MPMYEYQCQACSHQFEILQKFSEASATVCPKCNQATLQKLVSVTGFELKGTGWYATDFRNKPAPATATSTSTDQAPAAKTENAASTTTTTPDVSNQKTGTT